MATLPAEPRGCLNPDTDLQAGLSEAFSHLKADAAEKSQLLTTRRLATENPWELRCVLCPRHLALAGASRARPWQGAATKDISTFLTWLLGPIFSIHKEINM